MRDPDDAPSNFRPGKQYPLSRARTSRPPAARRGANHPVSHAAGSAATPPPTSLSIAPVAPLSWAVFAQDPLVQDPVSFCVADDGSLFIAESFRQEKGVEDNLSSKFWLEDDLQLRSVEDRLKMYEKWASKREGGIDYCRIRRMDGKKLAPSNCR